MSSSIGALSATKVATIFAQGYVFESDEAKAAWIRAFAEFYASFVDYAMDDLCAADSAAYHASKGTKAAKRGG